MRAYMYKHIYVYWDPCGKPTKFSCGLPICFDPYTICVT